MKGLLLPAVMAIGVHAAILSLGAGKSERDPRPLPARHTISLALTYLSPEREWPPTAAGSLEPDPLPVERKVSRIKREKTPRIRKRQAAKETPDPPEAEDREPAPASLTAETGPHQGTDMTKGDLGPGPASAPAASGAATESRMAPLSTDPVLREALPAYRLNPAPAYPRMARRRGIQGTVLLDVLVNSLGRVKDLRVSQSSGHDLLDQAALAAVRAWTYEPARRGDEAVEMWVKVPVRFELR
ncbi:MAG: energy transducer TonB [Thermodesulfobacteriota bacterium]